MSIKDEIDYVKSELSSDEKILENAFKLERIYKKHKIKIWSIVAIIVVGFGANAISKAYSEHKLSKANEALTILMKNPNDKSALDELKSQNPKLYRLYLYSQAVDNKDKKSLKSLSTTDDKLLSDLSNYHLKVIDSKAGDSRYYSDLSTLEKAYIALKNGKKREAKTLLTMIDENSPLASVAKYLKHYTITKDKK